MMSSTTRVFQTRVSNDRRTSDFSQFLSYGCKEPQGKTRQEKLLESLSKLEGRPVASSSSSQTRTRKASFVERWRQEVTIVGQRPPATPLDLLNFSTSPVALVPPERLRVNSSRPYDMPSPPPLTPLSPNQATVKGPTLHMLDVAPWQQPTARADVRVFVPALCPPPPPKNKGKTRAGEKRWIPTFGKKF